MKNNKVLGLCPICNREMISGSSIDRHHFYPKCKGGRITEWVHKICHRKIHSIWTESELAKEYNNAEIVKQHEEVIKFIKWVSNKDPEFYDRTERHNRKKRY